MVSKLDETLGFHEKALGVRAQRQQLIASNVANSDTPGYKAKEIDFKGALTDALSNNSNARTLKLTAPGHLAPKGGAFAAQTTERTPRQVATDGNTVDLDVERAQFANNAVHYEANLTFLSMKLKQLLSAIQG